MLSLIARKSGSVAAAELLATNAKCVAARLLATDAAPPSQQQHKPRNNANRNGGKGRASNNLLFGDDKKSKTGSRANAVAAADGKDSKPQFRKKKTFSFNSKSAQKEPEAELEVFEYPAYWTEDFPANFDDAMKHEVEKLQIFADFTPYLDCTSALVVVFVRRLWAMSALTRYVCSVVADADPRAVQRRSDQDDAQLPARGL